MPSHLELTREQILAYRRRVTALDERLAYSPQALRQAAWAGLQDSMPRAALLSIHARLEDARPDSWEDPALIQIWGPRFSTYVVAKGDLPVFTLGRLPEPGRQLKRIEDIAARLAVALDGKRMLQKEAAGLMGVGNANSLRYATLTGTVAIRWDGARQPEIWNLPAPEMDPQTARLELARRFLHVFGPSRPEAFAKWAGIGGSVGKAAFKTLQGTLTPVDTPIGQAWILGQDEPLFRARPGPAAPARLLPSGDTWFLLHGAERELLVPDANQRETLWTSRVWPGALLVDGETVGTWRRAQHVLTIQPWRRLTSPQRQTVEAEANSLPLPGIDRPVEIRWEDN